MKKSLFIMAGLVFVTLSSGERFYVSAGSKELFPEIGEFLSPESSYYVAPLSLPGQPSEAPLFFFQYGIDNVFFKNQALVRESSGWAFPSPEADQPPLLAFKQTDLTGVFEEYLLNPKASTPLPFSYRQNSKEVGNISFTAGEAMGFQNELGHFEKKYTFLGSFQEDDTSSPSTIRISYKWSVFSRSEELPVTPGLFRATLKGLVYVPQTTRDAESEGTHRTELATHLYLALGEDPVLLELMRCSTTLCASSATQAPEMIFYDPQTSETHPSSVLQIDRLHKGDLRWEALWHPKNWSTWTKENEQEWCKLLTHVTYEADQQLSYSINLTPKKEEGDLATLEVDLPQAQLPRGYYRRHTSIITHSDKLFVHPNSLHTVAVKKLENWIRIPADGNELPYPVVVEEDSHIPVRFNLADSPEPRPEDTYVIIDPTDAQEPPASAEEAVPNSSGPTISLEDALRAYQLPTAGLAVLEPADPPQLHISFDETLFRSLRSPNKFFVDITQQALSLKGLTALTLYHVGLFQLTPEKLLAFAEQVDASGLTSLNIVDCFPKGPTNQADLHRFLIKLLGSKNLVSCNLDGTYMTALTFNTFATMVGLSSLQRLHFRLPTQPSSLSPKAGAALAVGGVLAYAGATVATGGASLIVAGAGAVFASGAAAPMGAGTTWSVKKMSESLMGMVRRGMGAPNPWVVQCFSRFVLPENDTKRTFIVSNAPDSSVYTIAALKKLYPHLEVIFKKTSS